MSDVTFEYGLTRGWNTASIIFRKRGSSLYVYILEPTASPYVESGEVGSVSADECLVASDKLREWIRKGEHHPRGGRVSCKLEIKASHYGKVQRFADDEDIQGIEPHPEIETLTINVETDGDASHLADLFLEMNLRLRGLQP